VARIIEEVAVRIGADTRGLDKGLKRADKKVSALTQGIKRMGGALIAAFGARALFTGFKRTLQLGDDLIKTAKGVGFTVNEYQRLIFALDQVGVSAGSAKIALGDFQKRLSKAVAGTSPQFAKAFKDAGLDIKALAAMTPSAAFDAAMSHLSTLRNDKRIAGLTGNVFEEQSGKDVLQTLRQWEKYVAAREKFSRRIGELSKDQIKDIEALREETKLLTQQWEMLKIQIVADAAPGITKALDDIDKAGGFEKLTESITAMLAEMNRLVETIKWVATALDQLGVPDIVKKFAASPGGFTPQGVISKVFKIEDVLPRLNGPGGDLSQWVRGTSAGGGATTNSTTNVNITVGRGSNEITSKEAKRIRKQFEQIQGAR
jgi:hypothetical protein